MRKPSLGLLAVLVMGACSGEYRSSPSGVDRTGLSVPEPVGAGVTARGVQQGNCTLTQGFWKNHAEAWPVEELILGDTTYTKAEMLAILRTPPRGDATYVLIHQLIAAKLNVAGGADPTDVAAVLDEADAWLTSHPLGSDPSGEDRAAGIALARVLDDFNNGVIGPGHCTGSPPPSPTPTPTPGG